MLKHLLSALTLLIFTSSLAQNYELSPNTEISILTVDPGYTLYESFGHSAIRIKDPNRNFDVIFDYGRFNFNAPNFYLNFAMGKLNYSIGVSEYHDFIGFYKWQDRTVKEQILDLTQKQKQNIYDYLVDNYKPENRNYLYDFFYDNCATKIKDVINLDNSITFNTPKEFDPKTFRTLIQDDLNRNSWGSLGINIALGAVIDKKATPKEHMFLPAYIHTFFEYATFKNNGTPVVKENIIAYKQKKNRKSNQFLFSPLFVFGIIGLLILFITYRDYKKNRRTKWLDIALFGITGIAGVLILLLWFATDHKATHQNYNILWAFALNILVIGQLFRKKISAWFIKYLKFLVILLCLLTLHWIIGIQVFAIGIIPFLIALFIRYLYLIKHFNSISNPQAEK